MSTENTSQGSLNGSTPTAQKATPHESSGAGDKHKVVILGGGFAGIYAAKALAHTPVAITILDKTNHHLFQPMLYQVATGQLSGDTIASPIRGILKDQKNAETLLAEVVGIDKDARLVHTRNGEQIAYDSLIVATGSVYNYFGHEEQWKGLAPSLKTLVDCTEIRERILDAFERAEKEPDEEKIPSLITFVLVGGGPTGCEMAGAIAEMARTGLKGEYRRFNPADAQVIIIEAGKQLLTGFADELVQAAEKKLKELGIKIVLDSPVENIDEHSVTVKGTKIAAETIIWTAGTKGSPAVEWLGLKGDKNGRVEVGGDMTIPGHPEIFVVGDTAAMIVPRKNLFGVPIQEKDGKLKPLPGVAQPAIQAGEYAGTVIRRRIRGLSPPAPFVYLDKGNLAAIGRTFAIADLGKVKLWGLAGWVIWLGVHIVYLIGYANRLLVLTQWAIAYLTLQRTGRVLTAEFEERHPDTALDTDAGAPLKSSPSQPLPAGAH